MNNKLKTLKAFIAEGKIMVRVAKFQELPINSLLFQKSWLEDSGFLAYSLLIPGISQPGFLDFCNTIESRSLSWTGLEPLHKRHCHQYHWPRKTRVILNKISSWFRLPLSISLCFFCSSVQNSLYEFHTALWTDFQLDTVSSRSWWAR